MFQIMLGNAKDEARKEHLESDAFSKLESIRSNTGVSVTSGLLDSEISKFISLDSNLAVAIDQAYIYHLDLKEEWGSDKLMESELSLIKSLQSGFVNFYKPETVNQ